MRQWTPVDAIARSPGSGIKRYYPKLKMATSIKLDDAFKDEVLAAWAAYKETGWHLTGDEVCRWLATWGAMTKQGCRSAKTDSHRRRCLRVGALPHFAR